MNRLVSAVLLAASLARAARCTMLVVPCAPAMGAWMIGKSIPRSSCSVVMDRATIEEIT